MVVSKYGLFSPLRRWSNFEANRVDWSSEGKVSPMQVAPCTVENRSIAVVRWWPVFKGEGWRSQSKLVVYYYSLGYVLFNSACLIGILIIMVYYNSCIIRWVFPEMAYTKFMITCMLHFRESYPESCPRIIPANHTSETYLWISKGGRNIPRNIPPNHTSETYLESYPLMQHALLGTEFSEKAR